MEVTYVGPHDGVELDDLVTGYRAICERGKTITVPDLLAKGLLEQGPDHWTAKAKPKTTLKED